MVDHIADARKLGVEVLPPGVNRSESDFIVRDGKIVFGLCAIKGVGRQAADEVARARAEGGPFKDLFDLCDRVDHKLVNRAAIEKLIKAGAMDCFKANRRQLMEALGPAIQSATEMQQDKRRGQGSLFGGNGDSADGAKPTAILPDVEEWPTSEKLKYEKEALDFYFSSHPLAQFEQELRLSTHRVEQIRSLEPNQEVFIGGMLTGIRYQNTKNARNGNSRYVRCKLEDLTGTVECIMWPDDFVKHSDQFQEDRACFVKGAVDTRARDEPGLVLRRVMSIKQAKKEMAKAARGLAIQIVMTEHSHSTISGLAQVLQTARGSCPVFLEVCDPADNKARLRAGQEF